MVGVVDRAGAANLRDPHTDVLRPASPMKILLAPTTYFPQCSGVAVTVQNLARALVERAHRVAIVTPRLRQTDAAFEERHGIEIHRLPFVLPWRLLWRNPEEGRVAFVRHGPAVVKRLIGLLARTGTEIINVHHVGPHLPYLLWAAWCGHRQLILSLYGTELFRLGAASDRMRRLLVKLAFRTARAIVASARGITDDVARLSPNASAKVTHISPGVIMEEFAPRSGCSSPFPFPYFLSLSRLNAVKGHDVVLAAFRTVSSLDGNIRLVIAADGPQWARLHALALSLGLRDRVTFLGQVDRDRVRELLAGCEFLVNASWIEGVSSAVLEAMASRKPVIATRVGGTPEVVSDFETGRLVPPGDPESLSEAMLFLLRDRARATAMGERGYTFVKERHSFSESVDRYLEVYASSLSNAPGDRQDGRDGR
jgi:glycosyltransferase involved in cell wall biosynthesis